MVRSRSCDSGTHLTGVTECIAMHIAKSTYNCGRSLNPTTGCIVQDTEFIIGYLKYIQSLSPMMTLLVRAGVADMEHVLRPHLRGNRLVGTSNTGNVSCRNLGRASVLPGRRVRKRRPVLDSNAIRCLRRSDSLLISTWVESKRRHGTWRQGRRTPHTASMAFCPGPRRGLSGWPNDSPSPNSTTTS